MSEHFQHYLGRCQQRINTALQQQLGSFNSPLSKQPSEPYLQSLQAAMRYSLLDGGKRIRPMLVYAAYQAVSGDTIDYPHSALDQAACAVEMIHAYSLIHDDLPAMDDDDLRRGQPTCHKAFDEATAVLTGDALQTRAFETLTQLPNTCAETRLSLLKILTGAAGQCGMVGGQIIDLNAVDSEISLAHLETLHLLKTGALIRAAVAIGASLAGATERQLLALDHFASATGLAFQVQDDILDVESDTSTLGKTQGADIALNKPTYPALLGLEGARQRAVALHQQALTAIDAFDSPAQPLRDLSAYIISRKY